MGQGVLKSVVEAARLRRLYSISSQEAEVTQRLCFGAEGYARLRSDEAFPLLCAAKERVVAIADAALANQVDRIDETGHNWHLIRARFWQRRILSLVVAYMISGERRYRGGIIDHLRRMDEWRHWSWIAWRAQNDEPDWIFDLSYGENAATVAFAFDALRDELAADERSYLIDLGRRRVLRPYLSKNGGSEKSFYYAHPHSNWNAVCNGGAGLLALAFGDEAEESAAVLALVEAGIAFFFASLGPDGAWPEGLGYWNFGMSYGFRYLLSHERATGRPHPLLHLPQTEATLEFPLLLSPHGVACGFGDANHFAPLPFHYLAAERFGRWDLVRELDRRFAANPGGEAERAVDAELLLSHPRGEVASKNATMPSARLMRGLQWGYVADRMPEPAIYASVRGGNSDVPHAHDDLLSFQVVVERERLIDNVAPNAYYDSTFGHRRFELYETSADSKNTIFINGLGPKRGATVETTQVSCDGVNGFRLDATAAMDLDPTDSFCGRLLLLVDGEGVLIVDRIVMPHPGLVESRLHSFSQVDFGGRSARIRGRNACAHVSFSASRPWLLRLGLGLQVDPGAAVDTMIRHMLDSKVCEATWCAFVSPGRVSEVSLVEKGRDVVVSIGERRVCCDDLLWLRGAQGADLK